MKSAKIVVVVVVVGDRTLVWKSLYVMSAKILVVVVVGDRKLGWKCW